MATEEKPQYIRQVVKTIRQDPQLLDQLLAAGDDDGRKKILEGRGVIPKGAHGPKREEVEREIVRLATPRGPAGAEVERPVEWVAAIGTAAAGALAAFCAAE
jgi:hypothetical protein